MNDSKCNFFQQKIKYIEHTILKDRYQAYPDDAVALENFRKPPKTVGELRSRLGFFGYYRGYVKNFSIILKSLNNVLKGESNSQEIKTLTKKKNETATKTFAVRFRCATTATTTTTTTTTKYRPSPKYSK